jgi:hypothetical protein
MFALFYYNILLIPPMITAIQQSFLEARTALPPVRSVAGEIIVISTGKERGRGSNYHVFLSNEILHFVFLKDPNANQWICADGQLQLWLDQHNAKALQLLACVNDGNI